jgi:hypothetical protein
MKEEWTIVREGKEDLVVMLDLRECVICGQTFVLSGAGLKAKKLCSTECRRQHRNITQRKWRETQ